MKPSFRHSLQASAAACLLAFATHPASAHEPAQTTASSDFARRTDHQRTPEQLAMRFDKADVSLKIMPDAQAIEGVAVLDFTLTAPVERLVVELDNRFDVSAVSVNGQAIPSDGWTNPEGRMTVTLPQPLAAGQTAALRIAYAGQPHVAVRAPWDGGFVWATAPSGEPWIATAVQLEGCDLFWPCIDNAQAEPGQVDLHITVPSNLSAPSNGVFQGKTDHGDGWTTWNWSVKKPNIYAIALNVGPYEEVKGEYRSRFGNVIPLHYWHLKSDDPAKVQALFSEFAPMLDFFESTIGPFPFGDEKMGVVETPHLGMEHQTINAYGNGYKLDGEGYDGLLQHEFAHEWFANQLTNKNADDMWLHEGLGSYMQPLYAGWLNGDGYMHRALANQRRGLANRFPVVSGRPMTVDDVYGGANGPGGDIYTKGSLIAHSLRMLIGDEDFYRAITTLVYGRPDPRPGNFEPQFASTPDFLRIVNEVTGKDYGWFFKAYLYEASLPVLNQTRADGRLTLEWSTPAGAFSMPVEVEIDGRVATLPMTGGRGSIAVRDGQHVRIDPQNKILRQLDFIDAFQAYRREQAEQRRADGAR